MKNQLSGNSVYDTTIRLFILILLVGWCLLLMYPFISVLLWSLILALALYPIHSRLSKKLGNRPKLASFIIVFVILAIVILPSFMMIASLVDEVKALKVNYDSGTLSIPPPTEKVKDWPVIGEKLFEIWQNVALNLKGLIVKYKDQILETGGSIAKGILSAFGGVIQIIISLLVAGVILTIGGAGESIRKFFRKVGGKRGDELADLTLKTVGSVVKGVLGEALVLAMLHGIFFLLAGIPYAGLWTLLIFILAALQIPIYIVTFPMVVYFFAVKETVPAIIWSISLILVGATDNILTPLMLGKGAPVPMPVIYIGVIGGFILSGFLGLFTGAIVMSVGYKLYVGWVNTNNEDKNVDTPVRTESST